MKPDSMPRSVWGACLTIFGMVGCPDVFAQEAPQSTPQWQQSDTKVELRTGAARSDNITKSNTNERSDTIASAGVGFNYDRVGTRLDVKAVADLDWLEYLDNSYDAAALGYFDGLANLDLVKDTFLWSFRETFGQLVSDPLRADTPDNLENLNYFSTGPRVNLQLGTASRLSLYGSYSTVDYENLEADNDQLQGGVELARLLSDTSLVSLNVTASEVKFDDTALNSDYDMQSAFVRYAVQGFRTSLDADAGYSQVKDNGRTSGGTLFRIGGTRRMSASSNFFVRIRQQFSNAGNLFRDGLNVGNPTGGGLDVSSGDVFKERGIGLGVNSERARTQFGIGADWSKEEHEAQQSLDRKVLAVDGYLLRKIRPSLALRLSARYDSEKFDNLGFDDDRLELGASLQWQLGRSLAVDFSYDYADRSASDPTSEFNENRYGIRFLYRPLGI